MRRAGLNHLKPTTVFRPADSLLAIAHTHDRRRCWPWDRKVWIVMSYRHIAIGSVKLIDAVNDISDLSQSLESVEKSARNVDLRAVLIIEQEGLDLTEAR